MPPTNSQTETSLRRALRGEGYALSGLRPFGQNGVDIIASRGKEEIFIEVSGYKASGPQRSRDFYEEFFHTVARLNDGVKTVVMALPKEFKVGMPQRVKGHMRAWKRIGKAFSGA